MPRDRRNIYKIAREVKELTQEVAVEELRILDSLIRVYEIDQRIPPPEAVDLMVIAHDGQLLGTQHLWTSADTARSTVPDIRKARLPGAVIEPLDRVCGFADARRDREPLRIGKDGTIDDQGRPTFDTIVAELGDLVEAAVAVRCIKQGHLEEGVE